MPQLFKFGPYCIYFWSNESDPLEPIHVHIAEGIPQKNATKVWITRSGHCILANNISHIPLFVLKRLLLMIEANKDEIISRWVELFEETSYFC